MMMVEAMLHFETIAVNIDRSINWTTSCDYGGEGPTRQDEAHLEHYVYLALKPLPPTVEEWTAASAQTVDEWTAASARASARDEPMGDMTRNRFGTSPCGLAVDRLARRIMAAGWDDLPEEPNSDIGA